MEKEVLTQIQFFEQIKWAMAHRKPRTKSKDILAELGIEWV